jgi:translation elongation factor EF-Ts
MKTTKQTDILKNKIANLKLQRNFEFIDLKAQYFVVQNSFTIQNIVNKGVSEFYKTATNRMHLFTTITSILGGYLSKKMVVGESKNPIKKIFGYSIQFAITKLLSKITNP